MIRMVVILLIFSTSILCAQDGTRPGIGPCIEYMTFPIEHGGQQWLAGGNQGRYSLLGGKALFQWSGADGSHWHLWTDSYPLEFLDVLHDLDNGRIPRPPDHAVVRPKEETDKLIAREGSNTIIFKWIRKGSSAASCRNGKAKYLAWSRKVRSGKR